ncbi:MAG: Phosphate ABC transporter, phosphate-binding protein [Desulfotomaculum sp. 46_80]|nr:MAG: Phosphate ABC transporter, phosphate-binding protein [Desulfotomaculum sp. 46_80]
MAFRKSGIRFVVFLSAVFLTLSLLTSGCESPKKTPESGRTDISGSIKEAGSTSVLPLAESLALEFMKLHKDVRVETGGGGSGAGVKQCVAGTVDVGAISRDLKLTESDLISYPVARDAIAVIVNPGNPINNLKADDVARIYSGEVTDWSQIGGKSGRIILFAREEGSGTRDTFDSIVMRQKKITPDALLRNSNGEVQAAVSQDATAIGFVSLGYVYGIKILEINGTKCSFENCQNGSYPLVRRLFFITKGIPNETVTEFINFARSDAGQKIAEKMGFVPLVY